MASKNRSDGDGSIYYDKARDRWVGVYVVDWVDGKPIRRKVSGKSRAAAATKLRELRDKVKAGNLPAGRLPTVEQWLNVWLEDIAAHRVRATTMGLYRTRVRNRLIPTLGHHRLDKLRPEHIEKAWRTLIDDRGLAPASVLVDHRILSRALKIAQQRGHLTRNPATMIDPPSAQSPEADVLSAAEAVKILTAAADLPRNGARWSVALSLGLRPGEALGLRWSDVDLDSGTLHVRNSLSRVAGQGLILGPAKTASGRRTIALPDQLTAELKAHRKAQAAERLAAGSHWVDGDYVFAQPNGKPTDPSADGIAWHALLKAADVRRVRRYTSRHTAATILLAKGVAPRVVMDIMGHANIQQTTRYQHVADEMQREAMRRQGDVLWGG